MKPIDFDNTVYVYDKNMNLLAVFDGNTEGYDMEAMKNVMVAPIVHIEQNGTSTLSFQMLANSEKFQIIKDPENIFVLNGRYYTALNDGSYLYNGEGSIRVANVTLVERWYLLDRKYTQIYNCNLHCYAKATFNQYTTDGAIFTIKSTDCSNPGNSISSANSWNQVKLWTPTDKDGNYITYSILASKEKAPTNWENSPPSVTIRSIKFSGDTATIEIRARAKQKVTQNYDYVSGGSYSVQGRPYPSSLESVYVNSTIVTTTDTSKKYVTSNKQANYSYNSSTGQFTLNYNVASNETINYLFSVYDFYDLGTISAGATCTLAYGAEVVDDHTVVILPKADKKYKLTINGTEYDDRQVKDSRGVVMPRGSGGYAMWAVLRDSGWSLGICDVLATGFDTSIDYGCFNIESDMRDVLYNIQYVRELYGGILDWDSKNKILHYRAENKVDYKSYNDGFNDWTGYEFREGKNMTDQPEVLIDNSLTTKAFILGYGNLNIKDVNGGKGYVENYSYTKDVYEGYLEQPLIYDTNDDGGKRQLLYWGQKEIAKRCRPRKTVTIKGTDIRTVEGFEHEVFNINDIVKVYYKDSEGNTEVSEEHRIIMWEYNAFALWDCTVELGEKTQNFSELFKLIWNKSVEDAPQANASGNISSGEVSIEVDLSDYGFDSSSSSGGYYYSSYGPGYGYGGNLSTYIDLIARKTTQNTDAISGLIIQANELYAQNELFSSYQKQSQDMVSDTYASLKTYADGQIASVSATASGAYTYADQVGNRISQSLTASFTAQISAEGTARTQQIASVNAEITSIKGQISTINSTALFKTEASRTYATTTQMSQLTNTVTDLSGKITTTTNSLAQFETYVDNTYAKTSQLSQYATTSYVNGQLQTKVSLAEVKTFADANYASASLAASVNNISSTITVDTSGGVRLHSTKGYSSTYISATTTGQISIIASSSVLISASTISIFGTISATSIKATTINGYVTSWKTAKIGDTTINYLGR